jgi:hypothetical protein
MTAREFLAAAGHLLYGDPWQRRMARALAVDARTVRRWATGEKPIRPSVLAELEARLETLARVGGPVTATLARTTLEAWRETSPEDRDAPEPVRHPCCSSPVEDGHRCSVHGARGIALPVTTAGADDALRWTLAPGHEVVHLTEADQAALAAGLRDWDRPRPKLEAVARRYQARRECSLWGHPAFDRDEPIDSERFSPSGQPWTVPGYIQEEVRRQGHDLGNPADGGLRVQWMTDAWEWARRRSLASFQPTVADILEIGRRVEPAKNAAGFRRKGCQVGPRTCPDWEGIPRSIELLVNTGAHLEPIPWYYEYLMIHPFIDGNGRSAKCLLAWRAASWDAPFFPPADLFGEPIENP